MFVDVEQYLQRIGMKYVTESNLKTLTSLQNNHMLHIPFENLDVINGIPIELDVNAFYEKIVTNNRGGFCYELNGLFNWLLQRLGYETILVAASVKQSDGTWSVYDTSHACILVFIDIPYLVDVGFGDSVRTPLPLTGETVEDISGTYRIKKLSEEVFDLQRKNGKWETLFRLKTIPRQLNEFNDACRYNQTSPNSRFTQKEIVSLATKDGRMTLLSDRFIITTENEKKEEKVDKRERKAILKKHFNIVE